MSITALRSWLAVCLIVFASLISGYYSFFVNPPQLLAVENDIGKWEERMQPVRASIPSSIRDVGYISDNEFSAIVQEYELTKFALIPVVVHHGVDYEWIIGNFTQPNFENTLDQKIPSEYTIKKFGAGIYLIHRVKP